MENLLSNPFFSYSSAAMTWQRASRPDLVNISPPDIPIPF
jgi:hypothetical protein